MFEKANNEVRPLQIVISGDPGIGKTTFGATFKNPAFIRFEDGTRSLDGEYLQTPLLNSFEEGIAAVNEAKKNKDISSIIIDSISTLERMILEPKIVAADDKATSINDAHGGWGRGGRIVADYMGKFKNACVNSGKNCIYLCHSEVSSFKSVDLAPYNVLTLRLSKYSKPFFMDLVDCVGFLRLKISDQRDGKEKVIMSSDRRELICHANATIESKNRLKITKPLPCPLGTNPIIDHIKATMKG